MCVKNSTVLICRALIGQQTVWHLDMSRCCGFAVGIRFIVDLLYSVSYKKSTTNLLPYRILVPVLDNFTNRAPVLAHNIAWTSVGLQLSNNLITKAYKMPILKALPGTHIFKCGYNINSTYFNQPVSKQTFWPKMLTFQANFDNTIEQWIGWPFRDCK